MTEHTSDGAGPRSSRALLYSPANATGLADGGGRRKQDGTGVRGKTSDLLRLAHQVSSIYSAPRRMPAEMRSVRSARAQRRGARGDGVLHGNEYHVVSSDVHRVPLSSCVPLLAFLSFPVCVRCAPGAALLCSALRRSVRASFAAQRPKRSARRRPHGHGREGHARQAQARKGEEEERGERKGGSEGA
jgi:hypothetical protein